MNRNLLGDQKTFEGFFFQIFSARLSAYLQTSNAKIAIFWVEFGWKSSDKRLNLMRHVILDFDL